MRGGDPAQAIERMMAADANGDGKLSRDEMPEQMAVRIFDRADTNKDGFVDKIEIEIIVKEGGLRGGQGAGQGAGQGGGQGAGGAGRGGAPSFEGSMKQANRGFQALNKSALDASTLTADLASVQTLQMGLVGSKGGIAGVKMSDAAKAKFGEDTAKYQSELRRQILDVIMISFDIEKAILNGDTAAAKASVKKLHDAEESGHSLFQNEESKEAEGADAPEAPRARGSRGGNRPPANN
jgi:hypothetical protein